MTDDAGELVATMAMRETFEIRRSGKPKKEGGNGVHWTCSCGHRGSNSTFFNGRKLCGHLKAIFDGWVKENTTDPRCPYSATLTPLGEELLLARWAAINLRGMSPRDDPYGPDSH